MAKKFVPSQQQQAFFDWGLNGTGNAFVEAVAGAGKTTSLLELTSLLLSTTHKIRIIIVAYSKKIATELTGKIKERKMPFPAVSASTFHSFGFKAWMFHTRNNCKFNGFKIKNILDGFNQTENMSVGYNAFVAELVSLAKQHVLGPNDDIERFREIVAHHDLYSNLDKDHNAREGIEWAIRTLKASNDQARNVMDYDDMIYLPVYFDIKVFQHDFVLVDEAQDTNPARRKLAAKMIFPGHGRLIFVGDRHQAIFGFTGADNNSVDVIVNTFKCKQLPLTVSYRCPKLIVAQAQQFVDHIQSADTANDGVVEEIERGDFEKNFPQFDKKDAVLCRKTAPLVSLAYQLIAKGIACHVEGRDITSQIKALISKWRIKRADKFLEKLEDWEQTQVARLTEKKKETAAQAIQDRCETIRILADGCQTVQCIIDKVDSIFGDSDSDDPKEKAKCDNLTLSTVHKSKGREFPTVYILGWNEYMPSPMAKQAWEKDQEKNLQYVAITRAEKKLVYVG